MTEPDRFQPTSLTTITVEIDEAAKVAVVTLDLRVWWRRRDARVTLHARGERARREALVLVERLDVRQRLGDLRPEVGHDRVKLGERVRLDLVLLLLEHREQADRRRQAGRTRRCYHHRRHYGTAIAFLAVYLVLQRQWIFAPVVRAFRF